MPAEMESKTPLTISVVWLPGANDCLTPSPMAMAMGVEKA